MILIKFTSCLYRRYALSCLVLGQIWGAGGGDAGGLGRGGVSPRPDLLGETGLVLAQTREFGVESFFFFF